MNIEPAKYPMILSPDEAASITASLTRMGLIGEHEEPELEPLAGGISSLIVRARTSYGEFCVKRALPQLRVAVEWTVPVERNSAEVGWMRIADRFSPGSVPMVFGQDTVGKAFAMAWLDPQHYPVWKSQLLDGIACPGTARAVAEILSRIHNACAHKPEIAGRFANDDIFYAIRLDPYFNAAAVVHPDCAATLHAIVRRTASTRHTLVHGDISPKNILVGPRGPVVLDAECAWYGDPAFDLAFCLTHFCLKCVWRPQSTADYLGCFDTFASMSLDRCEWEPVADLEARTCALLAAMLLARVDGKSTVEYITEDCDKNRVRRFARERLHCTSNRLTELCAAWGKEWARP
jgi:aminoglycoside phosphotransferase (APT) family kinase protein